MLNIVDIHVHFDDNRNITSIDVKVKAVDEDPTRIGTRLLSAFSNLTLLDDVGNNVELHRNEKRKKGDIVDLTIKIEKDSSIKLSMKDVANIDETLQKELDKSKPLP